VTGVRERPTPSPALFAGIARSLASPTTVVATLQRIVDTAVETIDGCDGAGVLLVERRRIVVGAWSSDLVRQVEELEYELGEGPCLQIIREQAQVEIADLRVGSSPWPRFAARALDMGIGSMLAFRLFATEETLGALDLYSSRPGAFDEAARAFGGVFAAHAALALAGAQVHEQDLATVAQLREALGTRDLLGQAKGILMANRRIGADEAFDLLRATSQRRNEKVRAVATYVVETGTLPED
jgi:putative methionine-R-sulfoxide reductase with GAF domain